MPTLSLKRKLCFMAVLWSTAVTAEPAVTLDEGNLKFVCRAAISSLVAKDLSKVQTQVRDGIAYTTLIRPATGQTRTLRCKVEGHRIILGDGVGQWRNHPADDVIIYFKSGNTLTIKQVYVDGSSRRECDIT